MSDYIFKRFTPLKKEVFDIVINEMLRVGWKQLNSGKENEKDVYVMYSDGNDGKKNIYIEFTPYDGRSVETTAHREKFDVRTTAFSDAYFKFCTGYDTTKGRGTGIDASWPVSWFKGRPYNSWLDANSGPKIECLLPIELFLFVDKERISVCTILPKSSNSSPTICYIGMLDDLMLEELHEPYTRALTWYSSSFSGNDTNNNFGLTFERPQNSNWIQSPLSYRSTWFSFPTMKNPNIDNNFVLLPFYILTSEYGIRGKLGGLYYTSGTGIVSGDILEITMGEKIQKYKYIYAPGSYPSLPAPLAFRIE
ncbi:hypothetical protein COI89_10845 [Bacillus cereus]|nr:hypothetical protein COI89_10845 [Bacillus cereus]